MTQASTPPFIPNGQNFTHKIPSLTSPNSLPYPDESRRLIDRHVASLLAAFPSLRLSSGPFTYDDGDTATLLYVEGTISISHVTAPIELPLVVWLPEAYPALSPSVFVSFPTGTVVSPRHRLVDPSGVVTVPYLSSWDFQFSNLVDLVRSINRLFNSEPPCYLTHEAQKSMLISKVLENVELDLDATRTRHVAEIDSLLGGQLELKGKGDLIRRGLEGLEDEKDRLEERLQIVVMNCNVIRDWIRGNYERLRGMVRFGDVDEEVFVPADSVSRQKVECVAGDRAIDDAIYELDLVLREGGISSGEYLKNVRALSRQQFFHRAMTIKLEGNSSGF